MNFIHRICVSLLFFSLAPATLTKAADATPQGFLVEAESGTAGEVIEDNSASGGKAVTRQGDWQPLVSLPVPAGDNFKIWVRHKGGPFALKSTIGGKTQDNWKWDKPTDWKWTDAGNFQRATLGEKLTIIRNNDNANTLTIDAVVFAPVVIPTLPPFEPDENLAPLVINAAIDWNKKIGSITPLHWGINDYEILNPQNAADEKFQAFLKEQNFALIRIHNGGFSDLWTDKNTRSWDVEKIKVGFAASSGYGDAKIMLNVARWPGWFSVNSTLTTEQEDEFAALVGQLAQIMRDDVKHPIAYWELLNELENNYEKEGKLDDLWRLFNKVAHAVKTVDPNAKIGGPAFTWPNPKWIEGFLKNCAGHIDFMTWHNYASGDIYESNEVVFEKAGHIKSLASDAIALVQKYAPDRKIETFLSELNVKWTWDPFERRHANNVGAIFMASSIKNVALTGITGITQWHVKGNAYGMIDAQNNRRPPAYLYGWSKQFLTGDIAQSKSDDEKLLEILPIVRADGSRALLLMNKAPRTIKLAQFKALFPNAKSAQRIDATTTQKPENGPAKIALNDAVLAPEDAFLALPGYSLTLISSTE